MNVFRRLFPKSEDRAVQQAIRMLEHTAQAAKQPKGLERSAVLGAETRDLVMSVVDKVEAAIGQLAVAFAEKEGVLLIHPKLTEAVRQHKDRSIIEPAISLCFPTPARARLLNETWTETVNKYRSVPNSDDVISEKAVILAAFVVTNLDTAIELHRELHDKERELTDEQEITAKIEEAACWYRVIDQLAWRFARDKRDLFADHFLDNLAHLLALQGAPPDLIYNTMADRSQEYAEYKEVVATVDQGVRGTVLWEAAKHVGRAIGIDHDPIFWVGFTSCFVDRLKRALIYELLTGQERQDDSISTRRHLAEALTAAINQAPQGAAGGQLYAPLSEYLSRDEFDALMRFLVGAQLISQRGDVYFPTERAAR